MPTTFFGHPRGLATLFFTEMWERFSYYGMRALLLVYMVTSVESGGMGLDEKTGFAIYGIYTMLVYLMALPGGWLADRLFGLRKAVFYGGCIITAGHLCLALNNTVLFFIGLLLIVIGTGLLKPNISTLVGELYAAEDSAKRDSGFSLFFLGINIGAFVAPIITGYLGENIDWHYGFGIAGLGMCLGLIQFKLSEKHLEHIGNLPAVSVQQKMQAKVGVIVAIVLLATVVLLVALKYVVIDPLFFAQYSAVILICCTTVYFIYLFLFGELDAGERKNVFTIAIYFSASILFYMGYEQQGSSLNLFANRYTNMFIGNFKMPAAWMQSVPAIAVLVLSPLFVWLWVWLARRGKNPLTSTKLSMALVSVGLSYFVMIGASMIVVNGGKPLPGWLVVTYLFHTIGEICLYPVGLSAVSKLAPKKLSGQMMGLWFMSLALGSLLAGLVAGQMNEAAVSSDPFVLVRVFLFIAGVSLLAALIIFVVRNRLPKIQSQP